MKKHLVLYGDNADLRYRDLTDVDLVDTEWYCLGLAQAKAQYPNVTFLMYRPLCGIRSQYGATYGYDDYPEVLLHSGAFVYDEVTGDKVTHRDGWCLMDLTDQWWRDHLAAYIAGKLAAHPEFSGVFLDCSFASINPILYFRDGTQEQAVITKYAKFFPLASAMTIQAISCFKICLPEAHVAYCNGAMIEGFTHAEWEADSLICTKARWEQDTARLTALVTANKIALLQPGNIKGGGPNDEIHRKIAETGGMIYGDQNTSYCFNLTG